MFTTLRTADVGVTVTAPKTAAVGSPATFVVRVHDKGPGWANGVQVTLPLPTGASLTSISTNKGSCTGSADPAVCSVKLLAPGTTMTITVKYTPTTKDPLTVSAKAIERNLDPKPSNDTGSGVVTPTGTFAPN